MIQVVVEFSEESQETPMAAEWEKFSGMDAKTDFASGPADSDSTPIMSIVGMPGSGKVVESACMDHLRRAEPARYEAMVINERIEEMEENYFADENDPDISRSIYLL